MAVEGEAAHMPKLNCCQRCCQVYKVIFVAKITNLTDVPHIARELMMVKVR
jgi:acetolactate synthase small subunit